MTNTQMILCSPLSYRKTIAIPSRQSANIFSFVHMKLPPPVKQTSCSKKNRTITMYLHKNPIKLFRESCKISRHRRRLWSFTNKGSNLDEWIERQPDRRTDLLTKHCPLWLASCRIIPTSTGSQIQIQTPHVTFG